MAVDWRLEIALNWLGREVSKVDMVKLLNRLSGVGGHWEAYERVGVKTVPLY